MRILVASILTLPMARDKKFIEHLRRLHAEYPDAEIDLVSRGKFPQRFEGSSLVSQTHEVPENLRGWDGFYRLVRLMREGKFDLATSFTESFLMQLALLFSGIPEKYLYLGNTVYRLDFGELLIRNNVVFTIDAETEKLRVVVAKAFLRTILIIIAILLFSVLVIYWTISNRVNL